MNIPPQTEIQKKRAVWWSEHCQPAVPLDEVWRLNEELIGLFPMTEDEREQRSKEMEDMPEFVL